MKILKKKTLLLGLLTSFVIGFNQISVHANPSEGTDRTFIKNTPNKAIQKLENNQRATIVFFGDSNTDSKFGYDINEGFLGNHRVKKHPEMINDMLHEKYGDNLTVINSGIHGNNVNDLKDRVYKDVIAHNPDLVVLNVGTNDSNQGWAEKYLSLDEYRAEYDNLINIISYYNPNADIIIRSSNYLFDRNSKLYQYDSIGKELAKKHNLEYWDFNYIMTKDIKDNKVQVNNRNYSEGANKLTKNTLMTDGVHLTYEGQKYLAENFYYFFTKDKVFDNFYLSKFIDNFYHLAFDRNPDYNGKVFWYNKLNNHEESIRYFITNLLSEQEFINKNYSDDKFVDILYKIIFERDPDREGYNFWVNKYKEKKNEVGVQQAQRYVVDNFLNSDEFKEKAFLLSVKY